MITSKEKKSKQLSAAWQETKLAMLGWVSRSVKSMPVGGKASDVKDMLEGVKRLVSVLGDMEEESNQSRDQKADASNVARIGRKVGEALSQMRTGRKEVGEDDAAFGDNLQ